MTQTVLVGVDGSDQSMRALEYALEEFPDASIIAVAVVDPVDATAAGEYYSEDLYDQRRAVTEGHLETAAERAAAFDREIDTELRFGRPSRELVEFAEEAAVDHVVLGSHGRTGLSRVLLGSVAETVVRRSPVPVTVVR